MLKVKGLHAHYGHIHALRDVSLHVDEGEIVTLIGANGAGKSTLLMTVCGAPIATGGSIEFDGRNITRMPMHRIVQSGIAHAPEGRRIFPRMTVLENLLLGATACTDDDPGPQLERVFALFPRLQERTQQRGGTLSGGEQQMLAIARALMSRPRLLLLDEPSLGLAPIVVREIFEAIRDLNRNDGMTVFLVEQNAQLALRLAHRGYVLVTGEIMMSGTGEALMNNAEVRAAYLEGAVKGGNGNRP